MIGAMQTITYLSIGEVEVISNMTFVLSCVRKGFRVVFAVIPGQNVAD
jgi:hypothetical protein